MALIRPILPWVGKLEQHVAYFQTGNVIYLKTKTSLVIQYILIAAPKSAIMFMENAREYLFFANVITQMMSHPLLNMGRRPAIPHCSNCEAIQNRM